ncbi:MAG: 2Fe-2S iron-sulfur cluster binding domain-containing protein [Anaerolineae bacterium]|nr:2Fe-2S iron-sulfur cluster binding domain-containing protein [Anaerolineae bacterium]
MSAPPLYETDFEPVGKRVAVPAGTSLLDAARLAGVELTSDCGGQGDCGQCRIRVIEGAVTPPNASEEVILSDLERSRGERLACCTQVQGNVKVHIPKRSLVMNQRLQIVGTEQAFAVDPMIRAYRIAVAAPNLQDTRADSQRIVDALALTHNLSQLSMDPSVIRQISQNARAYDWQMTVYIRENEVVGIAPVDARPVGLAVDLGTTKLAARLVDLESGHDLAVTGAMNPQIGYGEDVISRLVFTRRNEGGDQMMAAMIRTAIDDMLGELVEQAGVDRG